MPEKIKKRISASISSNIIDSVGIERKKDKRSFSSMVEILLEEALKKREDDKRNN